MPIIHLSEVDSTNTYLKNAVRNGAGHLSVVYADRQTAGRGRIGRSFWSPENGGLYMSLYLSLAQTSVPFELLTPYAAVCTLTALDHFIGRRAAVKWVNDLYIDTGKICGILCEAVSDPETGASTGAVVGIGVDLLETEFPDDLLEIASSVFLKTGIVIGREALLERILENFSDPVIAAHFMDIYKDRSLVIGRRVCVLADGGAYEAVCETIDDRGHLHVVKPSGEKKILLSGEVSLRLSD